MSTIILQGANEVPLNVYYEIETESEPLGTGGMGKVYRGVRVQGNTGVRTDVAVKFLFDDLPAHAIERARREASIQIHNENLIEMFGFIEIDEEIAPGKIHPRYHVVSELLRGVMLFDLLKGKTTDNSGEEIPFAKELYKQYTEDKLRFALRVIKCVLSGVMALHDKGYIHRDIDPSNIMITHDGKVKLIDLGIAKPISDENTVSPSSQHLTVAGQFMGKAAYAAPELVIGDVAHENRTTDLYAVGILFFLLITGHLPFEGATLEVLDMQLHQKVPLHEIASRSVRKVIAKATAKKQAERYATASEFRVAVEQLENADLNETSIASMVEEKTQMIEDAAKKLMKRPRKNGLLAIAFFSVVVVGLSVLFVVRKGEQRETQRLQAEMEQKEAMEQLRVLLKDSLIDNHLAEYKINEVVADTIRTTGWVTKEAMSLLSEGSPAKAKEGVGMLERVVRKGYRSSAEAAYLLGRLHYEREEADSVLQQMKRNAVVSLTPDNTKAFHYDKLATELDTTHYKALYECGCDFLAGEARTGEADSRDMEKAKAYFLSAYRHASVAGDVRYVEVCARRLAALGVKMGEK
ncbi:serine/threonine protein kinase [Parabacteroides sp.]